MDVQNNNIQAKKERLVVIVTGLSGAGKNIAVRTLEDLGFYCVDNLPIPLIPTFVGFAFNAQSTFSKIALGIDARSEQFLNEFINSINDIRNSKFYDCQLRIIFLQSSDQVLIKRFQETRRRHPLAMGTSLKNAIEKEKELLSPLKDLADIVFDTDTCNTHELRDWIRRSFSENLGQKILINLVSFGFKYGVPAESNLVCDLRFLPNPYFVDELKELNGKDPLIQEFLFSKDDVLEYWDKLKNFLEYSINKYYEEGRFFANVSIGCTGGKHRSVAFVEKLSLQSWKNVVFLATHRDINKESNK